MEKIVLTFIILALFVIGISGVFVAAANAADSAYWQNRITAVEGSDLSENDKEFKLKLIHKYMGNSNKKPFLAKLALR